MRIYYFILFIGLFSLVLGLSSCEESIEEPGSIDFGYEYFPLSIGKYWEYSVDSIVYDETAFGISRDSSTTLVREEIVDTFSGEGDRLWYKIDRFERASDTSRWEVKNVFAIAMDDTRAFRREGNLEFIKLVFPVSVGTNWEGNQFNTELFEIPIAGESVEVFKSWDYFIEDQSNNITIGDLNFEAVIQVSNAESENLIELRFAKETYAKGVGLVAKEMMILDSQCGGNPADCIDLSWEDKAENGFILRQTILNHN